MTTDQPTRDLAWQLGIGATSAIGAVLVAWALTVNLPSLFGGFFADGATYYMYTHSIVDDWDFEYRREDLTRVWEEYTPGPEGLFLKVGRDVQGVSLSSTPPFINIDSVPDPQKDTRLYYAKAFIYPLAAAPFVWLFGTNGFFVLHALLMTACFACAYGFLVARSKPVPALIFAASFLFVSVVPAYLVLYMPDFFLLAVVLIAYFFWCYKEAAAQSETVCIGAWRQSWVMGPRSDLVAATLFGIASFAKPPLVFVAIPMLVLFAVRRQWLRGLITGSVLAAVVICLFAVNVAITGEWNYQGGDRKAFYTTGGGETGGFPFQTEAHLFEKGGFSAATNRVPVEVLTGSSAIDVFRRNLGYFLIGRYTGFIPYFFPGAVAAALFVVSGRQKRLLWQWLVLGVAFGTGVFLLLYMPFTYSGGGGPIGNRYFLGIYPLLLFVTPPLMRLRGAIATTAISALFATPIMLNPLYAAFHPGAHADYGVHRLLPVELTLLNDLPVNVDPWRVKQPLGGTPPLLAYFLDRNTYLMEPGDWFWVRGKSRAEMLLRAPAVDQPDGEGTIVRPLRVTGLEVSLETGPAAQHVTVRTDADKQVIDIPAGNRRTITLKVPAGVPYKPFPDRPTNYVYFMSVENNSGFVPMFHMKPPRDPRFLGIYVHVTPTYE